MHYARREARLVALPVPCKNHVQVQTWDTNLKIVKPCPLAGVASAVCGGMSGARPRSLKSATYSDILKQILSEPPELYPSPTHFGPPLETFFEMVIHAHILVICLHALKHECVTEV